ncbi:MAG TPA: ribosome small subunit-dependent GTPase A [Cyclobacteriaceae bacterium]
MTLLTEYGWNDFHQNNYININSDKELAVGRVLSIKGFKYFIVTEAGEMEAELSGKLMYGTANEELPKVGDWTLYKAYDSLAYLIDVLPRVNELSRKTPGKQNNKQVLATNVDYALIVQGLDENFNLMRLERYLVQLANCNINPLVVLNKADLVTNPEEFINEVKRLKHDCPVYLCSTLNGLGLDELRNDVLEKSKTYILIGSSGVGKSSLLNALLNTAMQQTQATSDSNSKGKHTTTTRDLFVLPNGSLLIDTPGMREFGLTADEGQSSDTLFPALQEFASRCRFGDCKHLSETGCGVLEALQTGELDADVYASYIKLMKEQRRFEIKAEDKKRLGKQFGKMTKEAKDHRKKYKN